MFNSLFGLVFTIVGIATAQANLVLALAFALIGTVFLFRGT